MTEEEKKVIENIENSIECLSFPSYFGEGSFIMNIELNDLKIILNLISKQQSDIEIKDKVIEEIKSKLQKHINFCEQESRGHLENKVCHISLKFEKNLLEEVEKVGGEDE